MTSLALAIVIAASILGGVLVLLVLRRATVRSTAVDLRNVTVSRQWLVRHHRLFDHDG
jgi:hypothetical protein